MKSGSIYPLALLIILLSCNNDSDSQNLSIITSCGAENPIKDLEWLKSQNNDIKSDKFTTSIYS